MADARIRFSNAKRKKPGKTVLIAEDEGMIESAARRLIGSGLRSAGANKKGMGDTIKTR